MKDEKGKLKGIVRTIAVFGMIHAGLVILGRYMSKRSKELEQKNKGKKKKRYMAFMSGKDIRISKEAVKEISIRTMMGGVTLNLTEAEITEDMEIKVQALMGGVCIKVPPMVRVVLDGTSVMGGFANMVPTYEREDIPTITVEADSIMGGVAVEMVPKL